MLRPQSNSHRTTTSLDRLWEFRIERAGDDTSGWSSGFPATRVVAVPASFNEQFTDYETFNHMGMVWYAREFEVPTDWLARHVSIRFSAVNYAAEVFLNGQNIGSHVTGYTPFECPAGKALVAGSNRLVVLVISESPAVSMIPSAASPGTLDLHIRSMREFMRRDHNHPSVIAWCLANEPHSHEPEAVPYFEQVFAAAREEDSTRPMMIVMYRFPSEKCHHLCDIVGLNAYPGWYGGGDTLENTQAYFRKFLDEVHALTNKPISGYQTQWE